MKLWNAGWQHKSLLVTYCCNCFFLAIFHSPNVLEAYCLKKATEVLVHPPTPLFLFLLNCAGCLESQCSIGFNWPACAEMPEYPYHHPSQTEQMKVQPAGLSEPHQVLANP